MYVNDKKDSIVSFDITSPVTGAEENNATPSGVCVAVIQLTQGEVRSLQNRIAQPLTGLPSFSTESRELSASGFIHLNPAVAANIIRQMNPLDAAQMLASESHIDRKITVDLLASLDTGGSILNAACVVGGTVQKDFLALFSALDINVALKFLLSSGFDVSQTSSFFCHALNADPSICPFLGQLFGSLNNEYASSLLLGYPLPLCTNMAKVLEATGAPRAFEIISQACTDLEQRPQPNRIDEQRQIYALFAQQNQEAGNTQQTHIEYVLQSTDEARQLKEHMNQKNAVRSRIPSIFNCLDTMFAAKILAIVGERIQAAAGAPIPACQVWTMFKDLRKPCLSAILAAAEPDDLIHITALLNQLDASQLHGYFNEQHGVDLATLATVYAQINPDLAVKVLLYAAQQYGLESRKSMAILLGHLTPRNAAELLSLASQEALGRSGLVIQLTNLINLIPEEVRARLSNAGSLKRATQ